MTDRASFRDAVAARPLVCAEVVGPLPVGKSEWRGYARRAMQARPHAARWAHEIRAAGELLAIAQAHNALTVALYSPIGAEVGTRELANLLLAHGHKLAYPRLRDDGVQLDFCLCDGPAALVKRPRSRLLEPFGVPCDPHSIDLMVLPALALNAGLARLGQGGGSYDRYVPGLAPTCIRVGLVGSACLVPWSPVSAHDAVLDAVCSDDGLFGPNTATLGS